MMHRFLSLTLLAAAFAVFSVAVPNALASFAVPVNDGFYTQTTPLMTPAQEAEIERTLEEIHRSTSNEIAILVVESLQGEPIEEAANAVFREWGIGKAGRNNGILILVASADHDIRIEVGYGLEGAVPDIVTKGIIEKDITPQFREARYFEGFAAGIEALRKHSAGEFTAERYTEDDSGNGFVRFFLFFLFLLLNFGAAWLGRTKSWWAGGILGGVLGIALTVLYAWWIAIPIFVLLGLLFDYLVSKHPPTSRRGRGGMWGGGLGGGRGGGGGFGGFGGGSSGGGGASGRW